MSPAWASLGRLERVELRDVWPNEAGNFTPWLAEEANIKLLGDAIAADLILEAQEKNVGPFRADILAKDASTDRWVLIENQIERTDHTHLGQLITYAAGLHAATIVWIAARFTDEHRAALDWLNEVTNENLSFFGLEVELWRIGNSQAAPRFNIISKPNAWVKAGEQAKQKADPNAISYSAYWDAFGIFLRERTKTFPPRRSSGSWIAWSQGRSDCTLACVASIQKRYLTVRISLLGELAHTNYERLALHRSELDVRVPELEWDSKPGLKQRYIGIYRRDFDPGDESRWNEQFEWMLQTLEQLRQAFSPYFVSLASKSRGQTQNIEEM